MSNVLYPMIYKEDMKISLVKGNNKLGKGVYAFNLLPGAEPLTVSTKGKLTDIHGTCVGCCDGCEDYCYAVKDAKRYHNTCIPSLAKNTLIMRNNLNGMFQQLKNAIVEKKVKTLRYHSSGEIESYEYLVKMAELAEEMPQVKFYFYTKRFNILENYLKYNGKLPDNLVANVSEWKGNTQGYKLDGLNVFMYDDGTDPAIKSVVHCPAVDTKGHKTGVTCDQCGRCFNKNDGHVTAVYAH